MPRDHQTPLSKSRKFSDISPEEQEDSGKRHCQDDTKMNEEVKALINEFRNDMSIMHSKMDDISRKMDERINKIEMDVKQVQEEIVNVKAEIIPLEEKAIEVDASIERQEYEINKLNQISIQNQVIMVNIASSINDQQFLRDLNKWTSNITKDSMANYKLFKSKGSQTAILDFSSIILKKRFLDFIKSKQKDNEQKYVPILNEHIFQMQDNDTERANVIEIRTAMTKMNRELFNSARAERKINKKIEGIWITNGTVNMRLKDQKKPFQLKSLDHLNELVGTSRKGSTKK
jgi:hypothetical protein